MVLLTLFGSFVYPTTKLFLADGAILALL